MAANGQLMLTVFCYYVIIVYLSDSDFSHFLLLLVLFNGLTLHTSILFKLRMSTCIKLKTLID